MKVADSITGIDFAKGMPARVYVELPSGCFLTGYVQSLQMEEDIATMSVTMRMEVRIERRELNSRPGPPPGFRERVRAGLARPPEDPAAQIVTETQARKTRTRETERKLKEASLKRFRMLEDEEQDDDEG
jgi:hypothetical protein